MFMMIIPWTLRFYRSALYAMKPAIPFTGREFEMNLF